MNKLLAALLGVVLAVVINTVIIMAAWNYLVPDLLFLKQITFTQALVMAVLVRALKGADPVKVQSN